jgi:hypothetical protein
MYFLFCFVRYVFMLHVSEIMNWWWYSWYIFCPIGGNHWYYTCQNMYVLHRLYYATYKQIDASVLPCFQITFTYMWSYIESVSMSNLLWCWVCSVRYILAVFMFGKPYFLLPCIACLWCVKYIFMLRVYHVSKYCHGATSYVQASKLLCGNSYVEIA